MRGASQASVLIWSELLQLACVDVFDVNNEKLSSDSSLGPSEVFAVNNEASRRQLSHAQWLPVPNRRLRALWHALF